MQLQKYKKMQEEGDETHIFDVARVDGEHLERIRKQTNRVTQCLRRYFPKKEEFEAFMME